MTTKTAESDLLRLFGMRNLMLEADLVALEKMGIDIGHTETLKRDELVDTDLFEADILHAAKQMANFYVLYYSLENTIRRLISGRLHEKHGMNWWELRVPIGVKTSVADKQKKEKDTPMSIRSEDPLTYTNFGELIDIINSNWTDFSDTLRSQKAAQQILSQFNLVRNVIAHSVELNNDEILRFQLLVKDWFRISG
ncbi:Swt1 family HEPN domain-containing protein [Aquirhabdus sp.]|uniref:Swt1 family HEPN domain-containing protein n=1 Tax=Aquirhabdus sp. TaxID=2824160 RepID=UPI00396C5255